MAATPATDAQARSSPTLRTGLSLCAFVLVVAGVLLPWPVGSFGVEPVGLGLTAATYSLALAVVALVVGRLGTDWRLGVLDITIGLAILWFAFDEPIPRSGRMFVFLGGVIIVLAGWSITEGYGNRPLSTVRLVPPGAPTSAWVALLAWLGIVTTFLVINGAGPISLDALLDAPLRYVASLVPLGTFDPSRLGNLVFFLTVGALSAWLCLYRWGPWVRRALGVVGLLNAVLLLWVPRTALGSTESAAHPGLQLLSFFGLVLVAIAVASLSRQIYTRVVGAGG